MPRKGSSEFTEAATAIPYGELSSGSSEVQSKATGLPFTFRDVIAVRSGGRASTFEAEVAIKTRDRAANSTVENEEPISESRSFFGRRGRIVAGLLAVATVVGLALATHADRSGATEEIEDCLQDKTGESYDVSFGPDNSIRVDGQLAAFPPDSQGDYLPSPGSVFEDGESADVCLE